MFTANPLLINILSFPLMLIDGYVNMLLFTTILNVNVSKKRQLLYVLYIGITGPLFKLLLPPTYVFILGSISGVIAIYLILKLSILKSFISMAIATISSAILEAGFVSLAFYIFNLDSSAIEIPIFRVSVTLAIYLVIYILALIIRAKKLKINIFEQISRSKKTYLMLVLFVGILTIVPHGIFIYMNSRVLPLPFVIYTLLSMVIFFAISIYSTYKSNQLEIIKKDLETAELYNKTLILMHDKIRIFKHDFNNIVQAIGGYVFMKDWDGLKLYYDSISADCHKLNNLNSLNPETINEPSIYGILASKYYLADEKGIKINLEMFIDLSKLGMDTYTFTKILGILLDNAIEATSECEEKVINISMMQNNNSKKQIISIENTYTNKDIDLHKIFEKDYSTKENNTGLGLWDVGSIVSKSKKLRLLTNKNDKLFKQTLEIFI